jgi:hypothetical protein
MYSPDHALFALPRMPAVGTPPRFFRRLAPGFYRSGPAALATRADGEAWAEACSAILARGEPFYLLVESDRLPRPPARAILSHWIDANRAALRRLVRLVVFVAAPDAQPARLRGRAAMDLYPCPVRVAAHFAQAFALCAEPPARHGS